MLLSLIQTVWVEDNGHDIAQSAVMLAIARVIDTIKLVGTKAKTVFLTTASALG